MDLRKSPPFPTLTKQQADPSDKNRTFPRFNDLEKTKSQRARVQTKPR